jgi:hypothetical protein
MVAPNRYLLDEAGDAQITVCMRLLPLKCVIVRLVLDVGSDHGNLRAIEKPDWFGVDGRARAVCRSPATREE